MLVDGHALPKWADALESLLLDHDRRQTLSRKAVGHAALFGWDRTTERLYEVYVEASRARRDALLAAGAPAPQPGDPLAGVPSAVVP